MCGIAGFIDSTLGRQEAEGKIQQMLESIAHRGPDAQGVRIEMPLVLGHNRLAIIDLSEEGNQPMEYFDAIITYNGEIYNYIEVREKLIAKGYRFKTKSDTEVILAAWREYGNKCVDHFMGMWAFALWDKKEKVLFCSRDRFGIKPFYYLHEDRRFYFGSEYKALKQSSLFSSALNLAQVSRGLQLGWLCYEDETYFSKLKSLPAGSNLIYNNGHVVVQKYWDIHTEQANRSSEKERQEKFYELFTDSIKLHMRSDVEVGGCLSGGLDSSAIASGIGTFFQKTPFKTFTIYYEGKGKSDVDERPWVYEVLKKYPALQPHYFSPTDQQIAKSFDRTIYHADVPIASSSPISQYFLMQLASQQKVKVVLDGQGSDEYLGGYMHSFYRLIGGRLKQLRLAAAHREFYGHVNEQKFSVMKSFDVLLKSLITGFQSEQSLYSLEYKNYFPFLPNDSNINFNLNKTQGSRLNNFLYHLTRTTSLPTLLQYEDRNSMAFSIESRVPFLDHRLTEYAFSLPDNAKIHHGETKKILRRSLSTILPEAITHRKDKKGFVTPGEIKWLRGPLRFLVDADSSKLDFLDQKKIKSLIDNFKKGENKYATFVWRIAVLNYWCRQNEIF